jgi:hypothetical protein
MSQIDRYKNLLALKDKLKDMQVHIGVSGDSLYIKVDLSYDYRMKIIDFIAQVLKEEKESIISKATLILYRKIEQAKLAAEQEAKEFLGLAIND